MVFPGQQKSWSVPVSEVLRVVTHWRVLLQIPLSGLACTLQADSDKVPSIVPYSGVL